MFTSKSDIRICVPCRSEADIAPRCKESLYALQCAGYAIGYSTGLHISDNRNRAITDSHKIYQTEFPFESIFFIDSDQYFTVEQFERILHSPHDVVSGAYKYRKVSNVEPTNFVAGIWSDECCAMSRILPAITTGIVSVSWFGAGFMRVTANVLRQMRYPYFRHETIEFGAEAVELKGDIGFCLNAKRAGLSVVRL